MHAGLCVQLPWFAEPCDVTTGFLRNPLEMGGSEERRSVVRVQVPCGSNGIVGHQEVSSINPEA